MQVPVECKCPYYCVYDDLSIQDPLMRVRSIETLKKPIANADDYMCREEEKILLEQWKLGSHPSGRRTVREPIRRIIRTA